jgi:hypothetical protein
MQYHLGMQEQVEQDLRRQQIFQEHQEQLTQVVEVVVVFLLLQFQPVELEQMAVEVVLKQGVEIQEYLILVVAAVAEEVNLLLQGVMVDLELLL